MRGWGGRDDDDDDRWDAPKGKGRSWYEEDFGWGGSKSKGKGKSKDGYGYGYGGSYGGGGYEDAYAAGFAAAKGARKGGKGSRFEDDRGARGRDRTPRRRTEGKWGHDMYQDKGRSQDDEYKNFGGRGGNGGMRAFGDDRPKGTGKGTRGGKGKRDREEAPDSNKLDADLDSYFGKEPEKKPSLAAKGGKDAPDAAKLDAALDKYFGDDKEKKAEKKEEASAETKGEAEAKKD